MKCVFIGYSLTQKGYKCYYPSNKQTFISIDVTFHENQPFYPKNQIQRGDKSQSDRSYEFEFFKSLELSPSPSQTLESSRNPTLKL